MTNEAREKGEFLVKFTKNFEDLVEFIREELDNEVDWEGLQQGVYHVLFQRGLHELYERKALLAFARGLRNKYFSHEDWNMLQFFWLGNLPRSVSAHDLDEGWRFKLYRHKGAFGHHLGNDGDVEVLMAGEFYRCNWRYDESLDESFGETESPETLVKRKGLKKEEVQAIIVYRYGNKNGVRWEDIDVYLK